MRKSANLHTVASRKTVNDDDNDDDDDDNDDDETNPPTQLVFVVCNASECSPVIIVVVVENGCHHRRRRRIYRPWVHVASWVESHAKFRSRRKFMRLRARRRIGLRGGVVSEVVVAGESSLQASFATHRSLGKQISPGCVVLQRAHTKNAISYSILSCTMNDRILATHTTCVLCLGFPGNVGTLFFRLPLVRFY